MLGGGVLSLLAGISAFDDNPGAALPGVALIDAISAVSTYMFSLIRLTCAIT